MKIDILREADYRYNFDRDMYFNRTTKKAFSLEFVDDTTEEDLAKRIQESIGGTGWKFYFSSVPPEGVVRELERVLG